MSIDWDATGSMLQGWGALMGAGAVIYAAKRGAETYESWKRQKVAERKRDQAERILTAVYKARRSLRYIRGPMIWSHELAAAEAKLREDPKQWEMNPEPRQKRLVTAQAYFNRLNRTSDEQAELSECLPLARALFGEALEKQIEELHHQFWVIEVDAESYIDHENGDDEFAIKIRRGMYDIKPRDGEKNEVSDKIASCIEGIESACLPALSLT